MTGVPTGVGPWAGLLQAQPDPLRPGPTPATTTAGRRPRHRRPPHHASPWAAQLHARAQGERRPHCPPRPHAPLAARDLGPLAPPSARWPGLPPPHHRPRRSV